MGRLLTIRGSSGRFPIDSAARPSKILFITPPYHCGVAEISGRWLPLNFVSLAGAARRSGLLVEIYDAMAMDHGYPEIEERLRASGATYLATSALTATITEALKILELAKRVNPATVTILGGIHPTFMYDELLNSSSPVDYIVVGEGEVTLAHLLATLEGEGEPAKVPGIAFRRGGELVVTPRRALMESIDDLPMAWDLLEWERYSYFIIPGSRLGAIATSRGCDRSCSFCSQQQFWEHSWRGRVPRKVVEELELLYTTYGVNVFLLTDEYPTRDRERWEVLLDLLIARKLPVSFLMETRAADIIRDGDILGKYRQAGVVHISIGAESGEQALLDSLRKEQTGDEVREALNLLRREGIVSEASFMVGFPQESTESVKQTLRYAQSLNPDIANFMALTPWPYTPLHGEVAPHIRSDDYGRYNLVEPVIQPAGMSLSQVESGINSCFRIFNMGKIIDIMTMKDDFRRGYLLRASKLMMGSPFIMKKLGGVLGSIPAKVSQMKKRFSGE